MKKYTLKQLKELCKEGVAIDITNMDTNKCDDLRKDKELIQIGYSQGVYGCNGMLLKSDITKELYVIAARNTNLFIF